LKTRRILATQRSGPHHNRPGVSQGGQSVRISRSVRLDLWTTATKSANRLANVTFVWLSVRKS